MTLPRAAAQSDCDIASQETGQFCQTAQSAGNRAFLISDETTLSLAGAARVFVALDAAGAFTADGGWRSSATQHAMMLNYSRDAIVVESA